MDLKNIEELLKLMKTYGADSIKIEEEDFKISLNMTPKQTVSQASPAASSGGEAPAVKNLEQEGDAQGEGQQAVISPTVGVFYSAPGPEEPPYVKVGDHVEAETIVCIIESMKVMNEIPAGVKGTVTAIFPVNGDRVEFEQDLMIIQADQ